jgi:hypothetical protein
MFFVLKFELILIIGSNKVLTEGARKVRHSKMFFVLKFELILIIGSNKVLTEGARKVYCGRRVGQGWSRVSFRVVNSDVNELEESKYRYADSSLLPTFVFSS